MNADGKGEGQMGKGKDKVVEMPGPATISSDPAPTWTLSAARRFDILAMVHIVVLAEVGGLADRARLAEMKERLREFELYEEAHRG